MSPQLISRDAYTRALLLPDLTDSAQGEHAMQLLVRAAIEALQGAWGCPVLVHRAHPIVSVADNYERLQVPKDAAARDARYTRYVSDDEVLRTHTSAMVPGLLRRLARGAVHDVLLACVGLVYRRDRIDRLSVGEPHQLDLWRVTARPIDDADLRQMVDLTVGALLPDAEHRTLPADHPYTVSGLEIQARHSARWVEIGECGLAAPVVLAGSGIDPGRYRGLAMGLGLDRALMLRKGIDDIRLLRATDARVADQMRDLSAYRPVSSMPPVRRDLSIAVAAGTSAEELGDRVRSALGAQAEAVETVKILSETPAERLPATAAERLGIRPGQHNLLVRVVLRHPTRTLTSGQANLLRDRIYVAIHEGTVSQWAARPRDLRLATGIVDSAQAQSAAFEASAPPE